MKNNSVTPLKQLTESENQALNRHLDRTEPDVATAFRSLIVASLEWRGTSLGFPKSIYIVFKSPRYNFAECAVQRHCVRIRLRRKAQYKDPKVWLATEPKMPTYALNKYFRLSGCSDLDYAINLLGESYANAAGIEPDNIIES